MTYKSLDIKQQEKTIANIRTTILLSLERFVDAWQAMQSPPNLEDFLISKSGRKLQTLVELIKIDLEYRYQIFNYPKQLDEYIQEHSELHSCSLPADLIYEEFYFRNQSGLRIEARDYLEKYPDQADTLRHMMNLASHEHSTLLASRNRFPGRQSLTAGQCIDDFELISELGQGSFAKVFKARQRSLNRLVAVKISLDVDDEPQTLAHMDHPNIVRVFDQKTLPTNGLRLLYMEYVPGGTLKNAVDIVSNTPAGERNENMLHHCVKRMLASRNETALPMSITTNSWPDTVCCIGAILAQALDYAHRRGILHLDIKPANILLAADGNPKLADFNVSINTNINSVGPNEYLGGSMAYMSLEQLESCHPKSSKNTVPLDGQSDVYSLGITLWQLLFGQHPFPKQSAEKGLLHAMEAMIKIRKQGPVIEQRSLAIAPALVEILHTCIRPNRRERWPSAAVLARELSLCKNSDAYALVHPRPSSIIPKMRSFVLPILILAGLLPNALGGLFNYYYNSTEIIDKLPEMSQSMFWNIQMVINLVTFPLGLGWLWLLALPVIKTAQKNLAWNADGQSETISARCLHLGHFGAMINIGLWSTAGIAYPLALHFSAGVMPVPDYPHFFGSLFFCGLITSVYPFFLITAFCIHAVYPKFIPALKDPEKEQLVLAAMQKRTFFYLGLAALMPLLAIFTLVIIDSNTRLPLALLSAASVIGLGLIFLLFRSIHRDLSVLREALDTTTKATA